MWPVVKISNYFLVTNLQHPPNKKLQINPDWQAAPNKENLCWRCTKEKALNFLGSLHVLTPIAMH
ncbi:hypothetical protein GZ78_14400 [Endozoicomonas numazuensis]|uniref:Uncharacterized protein n=1 Tax=Endozoicomonas numazuensis TaxID=1137799 RepID=A0A081NF55_9GAMM|nr:hypothetical protein GZ78_14400 [Endozoicomonas numazuensis]